MSNVNAGDLAVIVRVAHPMDTHLVGAMLRVVRPGICAFTGEPMWMFEPLSKVLETEIGRGVLDRNLKPITPPAGEGTDAEVRALYSGRELVDIVKERL
jgi:hypothetical protein